MSTLRGGFGCPRRSPRLLTSGTSTCTVAAGAPAPLLRSSRPARPPRARAACLQVREVGGRQSVSRDQRVRKYAFVQGKCRMKPAHPSASALDVRNRAASSVVLGEAPRRRGSGPSARSRPGVSTIARGTLRLRLEDGQRLRATSSASTPSRTRSSTDEQRRPHRALRDDARACSANRASSTRPVRSSAARARLGARPSGTPRAREACLERRARVIAARERAHRDVLRPPAPQRARERARALPVELEADASPASAAASTGTSATAPSSSTAIRVPAARSAVIVAIGAGRPLRPPPRPRRRSA